MRDRVTFEHGHPLRAAALDEFEAEAALAGSGIRDHAHHLTVALARSFERRFERLHVGVAADEARQAAGARHIEASAVRTQPLELRHRHGFVHALYLERPQVFEIEVAGDAAGGLAGQVDGVG